MKPETIASDLKKSGFTSTTLILFVNLILFFIWASFFEIDQTVRAQGQVIPIARTQVIQSADGGVLEKLFVEEGQTVKAGEQLAALEKVRSNAGFDESLAKEASLKVALVRAQAEANLKQPVFGKNLQLFPEFVSAQQALYEQRKIGLDQELETLTEALKIAKEELKINDTLFKNGDSSRMEVMRAERQVGEIEGKINATRNKYLQDSRIEVAKLSDEIAFNRYKIDERQSILGKTLLTSPIAGVVKYLKITTIGGVLRAGDELMQISPTESEIIFEVKVNPADIGQLTLGMPASIKLDAFDFSIYGSLDGQLTYISSDTLSEQNTNGQITTYYRAHIRIDNDNPTKNQNSKLANIALKPGMLATVDIKTGQRSVFKYLAKPVYKAFSGAMNER